MNRFLFAACFFLLPTLAFALSPQATGSATVRAVLSYDISVPAGAREVVFSTYIFPNTSAQTATYSSADSFTSYRDEFGNTVLVFKYAPNGQVKQIKIYANVTASFDPLAGFAFEPAGTDGVDYVSSSKLARVDSSIRSLSQSIAGNASDPLEKLALLASWVHDNVEYDLNYKDSAYDSVTTLGTRRGTCDEIGHLLVALLRAQGIPARHVVGFAFSGEQWLPHAWTEARINGEWVPADATFGELFFLDALHLRLAAGRDQEDTKYELNATGISDLAGSRIDSESNFSVDSSSNFSDFFSMVTFFPKGEQQSGALGRITARITNRLDRTVAIPISLTLADGFTLTSDADKLVLLGPGQSKNVSWPFVYPRNLKSGYSYNYSAIVSAYDLQAAGYLYASAGGPARNPGAVLENFFARKNREGVALKLSIRNTGNTVLSGVSARINAAGVEQAIKVGEVAIGKAEEIEFFVPSRYIPAGNQSISGVIEVTVGPNETITQNFNVDLAEPTVEPTEAPGAVTITPEFFLSQEFAIAAAIGIVLILLVTILVRKLA